MHKKRDLTLLKMRKEIAYIIVNGNYTTFELVILYTVHTRYR